MKTPNCASGWMIALAATALLAAPARAAEPPTLEDIRAKTAERLAALKGKEIKILWTAGREDPTRAPQAMPPVGLPSPELRASFEREIFPGSGTLLLRGRLARSDEIQSVPSATEGGPPTDREVITVADGETSRRHTPLLKTAEIIRYAAFFNDPVFAILCWFAMDIHLDEEGWSVALMDDGGKPAVVLRRTEAAGMRAQVIELWLDPSRGYLPYKWTLADPQSPGTLIAERIAEYAQLNDGTWAPTGGVIKRFRASLVSNPIAVRVLSVVIEAAPGDDSMFRLEFPAGTKIQKQLPPRPRARRPQAK